MFREQLTDRNFVRYVGNHRMDGNCVAGLGQSLKQQVYRLFTVTERENLRWVIVQDLAYYLAAD